MEYVMIFGILLTFFGKKDIIKLRMYNMRMFCIDTKPSINIT